MSTKVVRGIRLDELSKSELIEYCITINELYMAACQRIQILENQLDKKISEKYQTNRE